MKTLIFAVALTALASVAAGSSPAPTLELVTDLNPGARGSGPSYLTPFRGDVYFRGNSGLQNVELWRYDGTTVEQVAEINPTGSSTPTDLTVADDLLYFSAKESGGGHRLWTWDGTAAAKVAAASGVTTPQELIAFQGSLYFRGSRFGVVGTELFKLTGTALTTIDIYPGTGSGYPQHLAEYRGALYFSANGEANQGGELWRYDGHRITKAGQNINLTGGAAPAWLCVFRDQLYFTAYDGVHGNELWRFDGTTSTLVADMVEGGQYDSFNPSGMTVFQDALYFNADDGSDSGYELWKYDGTTFTQVAEINPEPPAPGGDDFTADANPFDLTVFDDRLYFTATDGVHGRELWAYDGTNPPAMVEDLYPGEYGSNPGGLRVVNGVFYMGADSGEGFGLELYRLTFSPMTDDDEDGMPDDWELAHNLNPTVDDAALDADGDGVTNRAEYLAGTDPAETLSVFRSALSNEFQLTWRSVPGKTYRVEINDGSGWELLRNVSAAPAPAETTFLTVPAPGTEARLLLFRVAVVTE